MADDREKLQGLPWRELFPWLILHRAWKMALAPPVLLLATLGCLLTPVGWNVASWILVDKPVAVDSSLELPGDAEGDPQESTAGNETAENETAGNETAGNGAIDYTALPGSSHGDIEFMDRPGARLLAGELAQAGAAIEGVFWRGVGPFQRFFQIGCSWSECMLMVVGTTWTLLVWGLFGGAITRVAVLRLGCDEAMPIRSALGYASSRLASYILSPLFPIFFVLLLSLPIALLGIVMRLELGVLVVSLVWILVLVAGLGMAYQLLGTLFGWPLMWVVISAEETGDHYEAYSRSFAYTFQRPFHYLFYAAVTLVLGGFGWLLLQVFAELSIHMAYWSIMWGAGMETVEQLRNAGNEAGWVLKNGRLLMGWAEGLVGLVAASFAYSFFWCSATAIYLLLRKSVDQTEFDEVFVDDGQPAFELPPLVEDDVIPAVAGGTKPAAMEEAAEEEGTGETPAPGDDGTETSSTQDSSEPSPDDDMKPDDPEEEVMF